MNYYKLNLTTSPIKETFRLICSPVYNWTMHPNVSDVLNEKLLKQFHNLDLYPYTATIFSMNGSLDKALVHKDVLWKNDKWQTVPCAVNWELYPVKTFIKFYDTSRCSEHLPIRDLNDPDSQYNISNGIIFGDRDHVPAEAMLLEEIVIDNNSPILFRTDQAHHVTFEASSQGRMMLSVRFNNISNWEHAVEKFSNLIDYS